MKPGPITTGKTIIALSIVAAISFALLSWGHKQKTGFQQKQQYLDTVPKKEKKIRDLDEAIGTLENIDIKIDIDNAMKEVAEALKQIDGKKISLDIQNSLKDVDFDKIKIEVDKAMKEVDFEKIKVDIDKAMKEIDLSKIEKDVKESMAKIDWDKMKADMDEVKKIDLSEMDVEMAKAKKELEKIGPTLEKELKNAKVQIENAKVELKEYKSFVDGLADDGLINKNDGYTIKHKNGKLIINDKEASGKTYDKYRGFLEKHEKFNIEKNKDDFNINRD